MEGLQASLTVLSESAESRAITNILMSTMTNCRTLIAVTVVNDMTNDTAAIKLASLAPVASRYSA
eukprot:scaffold5916_cov44-Cyclotella_meneghiniana.AAC.15